MSLGLSLSPKPLFPRTRPPLTCQDQRQGRGLLFRLPFLIQNKENRPIPEPHTALEHSPSPPGSSPPHRPHTMVGRQPGEGPGCRIVDLELEGTLEMLYTHPLYYNSFELRCLSHDMDHLKVYHPEASRSFVLLCGQHVCVVPKRSHSLRENSVLVKHSAHSPVPGPIDSSLFLRNCLLWTLSRN